jgi:hypothetical protein
MGILYQGGAEERSSQTQSLENSLKTIHSDHAVIGIYNMLFVLLTFPALRHITVIGKEIGCDGLLFPSFIIHH